MSNNEKRIQLSDEEVEQVAGGNVKYKCTTEERYAWGTHNPDVKYGFYSKSKMIAFIRDNYDYYGEAGIFQAMVDAGICYPL